MSYDITLIDPANPDSHYEVGNYTGNVSQMWSHAFRQSGAKPELLSDLDGRLAKEAAPELAAAVSHMASHPEEYEPMNPGNGWGDHNGALRYLVNFLLACRYHPDFKVQMCY
jgi:hypothetical protein